MASLTAIRYNKPCRECYQRLKAAGKASNVALMAVVNKLLRQAFAVVKFDEDFNPNYQPILRSFAWLLTQFMLRNFSKIQPQNQARKIEQNGRSKLVLQRYGRLESH